MTDRIQLTMNVRDAVMELARGDDGGYNPGALRVAMGLFQQADTIDPDSALGGLGPLLLLDTFRVHGPRVWLLYKDICGQDYVNMVGVLRAVQMGLASREDLTARLDAANRGKPSPTPDDQWVTALLNQVQEKLPRFARPLPAAG